MVGTPASTDDLVIQIDRIQYETRQGPCLSAISEESTVRANDLRGDTRWPKFAQRAVDLGVMSMVAFQLYVRERDLGALNLYSKSVDVLRTRTRTPDCCSPPMPPSHWSEPNTSPI